MNRFWHSCTRTRQYKIPHLWMILLLKTDFPIAMFHCRSAWKVCMCESVQHGVSIVATCCIQIADYHPLRTTSWASHNPQQTLVSQEFPKTCTVRRILPTLTELYSPWCLDSEIPAVDQHPTWPYFLPLGNFHGFVWCRRASIVLVHMPCLSRTSQQWPVKC